MVQLHHQLPLRHHQLHRQLLAVVELQLHLAVAHAEAHPVVDVVVVDVVEE